VDNIPSVFLSRKLFLIIAKVGINLDVVKRYYGFVTCRYTIILKMPHVTRHFIIQAGTMSIEKHSDTD